VSVNFLVKKTIRIDGKDYESLDDVPQETRAAVEKALATASDPAAQTGVKLTVNGHTYASADELPAPLRTIVQGAVAYAAKKAAAESTEAQPWADTSDTSQPVRPESVVSPRLIAAIGLILLGLVVLFRLMR
jgi:hypothetical protein